jgi:hypothetical protein
LCSISFPLAPPQASSRPKDNYYCARSTSNQEGYHYHINQVFDGDHTGLAVGVSVLGDRNYRWNYQCAVEARGACPCLLIAW